MSTIAEHGPLPTSGLDPFFTDRHAALRSSLGTVTEALSGGHLRPREVARALGDQHGLYRYLVPAEQGGADGGSPDAIDARSLVVIREALGYASPLADAIFAVQGLGTYPVAVFGSDGQRKLLGDLIAGEKVTGFALTEPEAGSDVASLRTQARRDGDGWVLDGDKTLISNAPIADMLVVFANADPSRGKKGISAFIVATGAAGLTIEAQPMSGDHPIGALRMTGCRVGADALIGEVGSGLRIALATLETFRISVGAAACGMAAAALADSIVHVGRRVQFGKPLAEQQIVQSYLAEMATELDAARLLVARAAYLKDTTEGRPSREVAMAKLFATESAQRIIDRAVQLHGGRGVLTGTRVEALYRDIRPLRIYEGTSEIQKLIIARTLVG